MLALVLALLPLALGSAEAPRQDPPPAVDRLECAGCEGSGRAESLCWVCSGSGKHECRACSTFEPRRLPRHTPGWIPLSLVLALGEQFNEKLDDFDELGLALLGASKDAPKRVKLKDGEMRCPAGCRGGKLLLHQDWVDCKLCKKGKFACKVCKKGKLECHPCSGKGESFDTCFECAGSGSLPDPAALAVDTCPWCEGAETRACHTCDDEGVLSVPCLECLGRPSVACGTCKGLEEIACTGCGGRGRSGPKKSDCWDCGEKGVLECYDCEEGRVDCAPCSKAPPEPIPCPDCSKTKKHGCSGCADGAYWAWRATAERLLERGDADRAALWLAEARARCERRYDDALVKYADYAFPATKPNPALNRKAISRERKEELRELDQLARKVKRAQKD